MRSSSLRGFLVGLFGLALCASACGSGDNSKVDGGGGAGATAGAHGGQSGKAGAAGQAGGPAGAAGLAGAAGGAAGGGAVAGGGGQTNGGADGGQRDGGTLDLSGVTPPAMLTATVLDRRATTFELVWTAPSNGGAAVSGYEVRYAKVPITTTNFDDTTTTAVTYTGTPKSPGDTDGMVVKAYIENGYYFAVTGTNAGGTHVGTFMATTTAVTAHFEVTTIPSTSGTNEQFGFQLSAENDLNGDGLSDILAGTFQAGKAYLFLGSSSFASGSPSVVFSGSTIGFGTGVAQIGDIDHDGLGDIAIADPNFGVKVYIYKGRTNWPPTLTDAQADYVISTDSTYSGSTFGLAMARLGDFTGDNVDDFAIGADGYGSQVGRVVIIPGKASGFASVALADPVHSIVIDGDATLGKNGFGLRVLGLGHFYNATGGTTLIASAPGLSSNPTSSAGHVYAFHGQAGSAGVIPIASADHTLAGPAVGTLIGSILSNLGAVLGSFPAVGIGNPSDSVDFTGMSGAGYLTSGTPATGPFANKLIVSIAGGTDAGNVILGGGFSGQDGSASLIGDATPDLVFGAQTGAALTISDGSKLGTKSSPAELTSTADVTLSLPTGWTTGQAEASLIHDINGDGFTDFCIGNATQPGTIAVYW